MSAVGDFLISFLRVVGWVWLATCLALVVTFVWFLLDGRRARRRRERGQARVLARNARARALSLRAQEELGDCLAREAQAYLTYREEML